MKASELKQIIREEIGIALKEDRGLKNGDKISWPSKVVRGKDGNAYNVLVAIAGYRGGPSQSFIATKSPVVITGTVIEDPQYRNGKETVLVRIDTKFLNTKVANFTRRPYTRKDGSPVKHVIDKYEPLDQNYAYIENMKAFSIETNKLKKIS